MPRTFIGSLALVGLFALTACKQGGGGDDVTVAEPIPEQELPDATASALCELFFGCSCESGNYPDEPTCIDSRRSTTDEQQQAAQAAGLIYDAQCAGDLLALVESSGCEPQLALDCDTYCAVYHGEQGVGQPCTMPVETQPTWSDCQSGLWCLQGTCQDACGGNATGLGVGEMCRNEQGESLGDCQSGLFCDFENNVCIALPGPGEPCYLGEVCGAGATCDFSGSEATCVPLPGAGEACTFQCDVGLYCNGVDGVDGTCVALPGEGQPCSPSGACAEGNLCNDADVCEALPAWVCST